MSEESLAHRFTDALRSIDANLDARIVTDLTVAISMPDGAEVVCSLDSLAGELRIKPDDEGLVDHYARSLIVDLIPFPDEVVPANVLPFVKPVGWAENASSGPDRAVVVRLTASIETVFVEVFPRGLRFVAERHLREPIADVKALRAVAHRNLATLASAVELTKVTDASMWFAALSDRFELNASLALLPEIWALAENAVGGPVICSIPERESCLFVAADDAGSIAEIRDTLGPALYQAAGYPISAALLRLDGTHLAEVLS